MDAQDIAQQCTDCPPSSTEGWKANHVPKDWRADRCQTIPVSGIAAWETQNNPMPPTVPPRGHVVGYVAGSMAFVHILLRDTSGEPKIADLEHTLAGDKNITGLEISVDHVCRMNIFEPAKNLVQETLDVELTELDRRVDHLGKIVVY
ncbi:hypothetical protein OGAPHI_002016 [Ogataea philodendri]|uniref:Uncharacterized protein n=1 Tax=Ogataea philodendri TaxID=1378263 RepID=A0A9P8PBE9_9ASCO|nr:uncharacterized protein OGAPHI_002016 [Ogataea philodendri]KAH3668262.1 hypothetical protein OGAPHI_002016 [Ogataea philodendri]